MVTMTTPATTPPIIPRMKKNKLRVYPLAMLSAGADPGFQAGGALKKIAASGGRRENFWGISCEKSRFYANFLGGALAGCAPLEWSTIL